MAHLNPQNHNLSPEQSPPNHWGNSLGGSFYGTIKPKPPKIPRWKIGLGIFGVFLLLFFVLFSQEIGNLLNFWGIKAQKPGGPAVILSLDPIENTGGPTDTVQYIINIQTEHGTYLNSNDPSDPHNGDPLPFLGNINFNVDDLVNQYPEFIQSAQITVPVEDPSLPGNNPDAPRITVLDDLNAFGLFTNRRLTPPDLGFITTPPILTIILTDYALERGGGSINFQVSATLSYLPSLGTNSIAPPIGQEPTITNPEPVNGILHLEGEIAPQPDFTLEVIPEFYDANPNTPEPDPLNWGDAVNFTVRLTTNSDFTGENIDLSSIDLEGYKSDYFDLSSDHPNGYTFSENPVISMPADGVRDITLRIFTKPDRTDTFSATFVVDGNAEGIADASNHHDNGQFNVVYTPPPRQDFYLMMIPPTDQTVVLPDNTAIYTIFAVRDNFTGNIVLSAETDTGLPLADQPGISSVALSQDLVDPDKYFLTIIADGSVTDIDYPFYIKGVADLGGIPTERWAPSDPDNLNQKNIIPAYFRLRPTPPPPDFKLSITPNPHDEITWGNIAEFTITLTSNETQFNGDVQLTSNQLADYKSNGYLTDYTFDGNPGNLVVAVSPTTPAEIILQLLTTPGREEPLIIEFTVDGVAAGIDDSLSHHVSSSVPVKPIPPDPDFTLEVSPTIYPNTIFWGDSASFTLTLKSINGFDKDVVLTSNELAGFKTGGYLTDYIFNNISTTLIVHVQPDIDTLVVLRLATNPARSDINYPLPFYVNGLEVDSDPANIETDTGLVNVTARPPEPDFKLTILPDLHDEITWGSVANFTITLESNATFSGDIQLSSSQLEAYKTSGYLTSYTFATNPVNLGNNDTKDINLQLITAAGRSDTQNLTFIVDGTAADIPDNPEDHHADSSVLVEPEPLPLDFIISVTPNWQEVNAGGTVEYTIEITRDAGFTETIQLTNNLISDYSDYIAQATFDITDLIYGESDSTTLRITTKTISESYPLTFTVTGTATDGAPQHSALADLQINVVVVPPPPPPPTPDFTIEVKPDLQSVDAGGATDYTITIKPINNFTATVILTHNLLSEFGDYISNVEIIPIQVDPDNNYTTNMHVVTKTISNSHILTFTVTGTAISGSPIHTDNADLQINVADSPAPPPPSGGGTGPSPEPSAPTTGGSIQDFNIQVTPITNTTINPGQSATYQVTIIRLGGFTGPVTLSTNVLQLNQDVVAATFGKIIIPTGETTTTLLLVARPNATIGSTTTFNVTGTNTTVGDRVDDASVTIVVPIQLPSTGPANPSVCFWITTFLMTLIGWQQLHQPLKQPKTK